MRRYLTGVFPIAAFILLALTLMGSGPSQAERPPQPFKQDLFSGTVLVQGAMPPEGTLLIACIDDCESVYQSDPYSLAADGSFGQLEVNPLTEELVNHEIFFFLVNKHGRIRATETRRYKGVFDFYDLDLNFADPLPAPAPVPVPTPTARPTPTPRPTPTASLPIAGDPAVALLPRMALMAGGAAVVLGGSLLLVTRRRAI